MSLLVLYLARPPPPGSWQLAHLGLKSQEASVKLPTSIGKDEQPSMGLAYLN